MLAKVPIFNGTNWCNYEEKMHGIFLQTDIFQFILRPINQAKAELEYNVSKVKNQLANLTGTAATAEAVIV